jgi:hypothetical protein
MPSPGATAGPARQSYNKIKNKEMGSRYLFIWLYCLYVWLEKYSSRGDYRKRLETPLKGRDELKDV